MNDVIVGMGEVLWDMLPEGKKIGGAPANFAYHVSQYGFDSCVVSAVGDDKLGNEILESFDNRYLNYLIEKVPYPTGTVQIELDEAGIPCYEIKENVAWDNIPFTAIWRSWQERLVQFVSVHWLNGIQSLVKR